MSGLKDKAVLITGGTAGIGRAIALAFGAAGARIAVTGRNESAGRATVADLQRQGIQAHYLPGDAAREDDHARWVKQTVSRLGKLDVAVNNAGIEGSPAPIAEATAEDFDSVFGVNVRGLLLAMKHQLRAMRESRSGAIVNLSSVVGSVAMPGAAVYVASKHAVEGLTRVAALETAGSGVRVNAVAPGAVATPMYERFTGGNAAAQSGLASAHPIGRVATPEEITGAVLYLASDAASFTTGTVLAVDGGYTAR